MMAARSSKPPSLSWLARVGAGGAVALALVGLGCTPPRRQPMMPPPMMQPAPALDPGTAMILERCDRALRAIEPAIAEPHAQAFASMARERLALSQKAREVEQAFGAVEARIHKARAALRALSRSEHEQALIAGAIVDLDEGKPVAGSLPSRIQTNEAFRDLVEASQQLRDRRAERARVQAQIDALDETFASMLSGPAASPGEPPHGSPYPASRPEIGY